jgi:peptidyl-prolyl cis-trans isomerase B (cyclophilin B)
MKRKILTMLCAVTLTAGLLAGCGSSSKDKTADTTDTTADTENEEEDEPVDESDTAEFSDGDEEVADDDDDAETVEEADTEDTLLTANLDTSENLTGIHHAVIEVKDYGTIELELDADTAPITVTNFVKLAQENFYEGLTFHRIMDGFMIQGGDPNGNGTGGSDETIKGEFSSNGVENDISHERGVISMARATDPDSASSQFFIVQSDSTFLDGEYAAFGYVTSGMEIVDKICEDAQPTDNNGTIPADEQPVIENITIID